MKSLFDFAKKTLQACEFPKESLHNPIQLTILDSVVRDMRSKKPVRDLGFNTKEIYIDEPWVARGNSLRSLVFEDFFLCPYRFLLNLDGFLQGERATRKDEVYQRIQRYRLH